MISILEQFHQQYSYICVEDHILISYLSTVDYENIPIDKLLDNMQDYVISQDLAEEVVL